MTKVETKKFRRKGVVKVTALVPRSDVGEAIDHGVRLGLESLSQVVRRAILEFNERYKTEE